MKFKLTCEANPGPVDQWSQMETLLHRFLFFFFFCKLSGFLGFYFFCFSGGLNCIVANASNNGHRTFGFLSLSRPRLCVKPAEGNPQEKDAQRCSLN